MDKSLKIFIGALLGILVLLIVIDATKEEPVSWEPRYMLDFKNPLDLYVFNQEATKIITPNKLVRITETPYEYFMEEQKPANYLIININAYQVIDSVLMDEVYKGSNLMISAENIIKTLTDTLGLKNDYIDIDITLDGKDSADLFLTMSNWKNKKLRIFPVFNSSFYTGMDSSTTTILGTAKLSDGNTYPNFVKISYGKGFVFLHNLPQVFTNFSLLSTESSAGYVAHVLSYLPQDKPVVWFVKDQTFTNGEPENPGVLSVIFRYPSLRAAWLIFIYGLLLYLLFHAKRRQRIIPTIKPLKNTTVEFVQTVGNLYYQEGDVTNITEKKIIYFLDKIRHKYYLDTSVTDKSFAEKLQKKSGKNPLLIQKLLEFIKDFERNKAADKDDLIRFNKMTEEFWQKEK